MLTPASALIATLAALSAPACAQWPYRIALDLLATSTDTFAGSPWIAEDGLGGVFLAWDDNRNSALTGRDIYVQHFDAAGIAQWTPDGMPVVTASEAQIDPIVVSDGAGAVYVVWSDSRLPNSARVYAQRFDATGGRQWAINGIRVGSNEFAQTKIAAAGDGAGNLFITWAEAANGSRTFVQKLDAAGAPRWGPTGLEFSAGVFGGGSAIGVVPDGAGGAVVAWVQFGDNPRTVWAQRILNNGTPAFDAVGFGNDTEALANWVALAADGTGGAMVGWQGDNGTDDNLYVQRVDGAGALPWGTASLMLTNQPNAQSNLQLVADGSGGAYCVWEDPRSGTNDVYVQGVTSDGVTVFPADGMAVGVTAHERFGARLVSDGAGGAIVTFRQNQEGIFAQKIGADGNRKWGTDGVRLTQNGSVTEPRLAPDGNGGAVLSVIAFKNGNRPALKRILANGRLTTSRLANISTRAFVGTGDAQAIPGFVVGGVGAKKLMIRAVGPTLGGFGVEGALADPVLALFDSGGHQLRSRDDWGSGADAQAISDAAAALGAFPLEAGGKDAAIVEDLAVARYTTGVSGVDATTGIALLEVYDADPPDDPAFLANLSSRVLVGVGDAQAIPGFVIDGDSPLTLLIRVVGPGLEAFGVSGFLGDPVLTLFDGNDAAIATNNDWGDGGATMRSMITDASGDAGAFPLANGSRDSVLLVTLEPGRYTAGAAGAAGGVGVCLVELYLVP